MSTHNTQRFDLLVRGGEVYTPSGLSRCDVGISGGRFVALGDLSGADAEQVIDAAGLHVLPGVIDTQVHFREPGLTHKEDLATGSASAALGGVTAFFEMPNTKPNTDTPEALVEKLDCARGRCWTDHAFYVGATGDNAERLGELELLPGCAGVKIFMGSSTGSLLVADDETLARVLANGRRRVAVHCEDEPRLIARKHIAEEGAHPRFHHIWRDEETARLATERLLRTARAVGRRVHVLHVTTAEEMALLAHHRDVASVEVTPQHLTLTDEAYERLGTRAQMNPPIRTAHHREALWVALRAGVADVIGSDHAPHTLEEKARPYPKSPSGMPGVQTLVPLMLDHVNAGRLSLQRFVDLTSAGAARLFDLASKGRVALGYDADLTLVDMSARETITDDLSASRCGWTPFHGKTVTGWPVGTIIRGNVVMRDGELQGAPIGAPVRFRDTLNAR